MTEIDSSAVTPRAPQLVVCSVATGIVSGAFSPSQFGCQAFLTAFSAAALSAMLIGLVHAVASFFRRRAQKSVRWAEPLRKAFLLTPSLVFLALVVSRGGLGLWWSVPLAVVVLAACLWFALIWKHFFSSLDSWVTEIGVLGCFFWMHLRTGTLLDIKPGTEMIHLAFYAVSVLGSVSLAQFAGGYSPWGEDRTVSWGRHLVKSLPALLLLILGGVLLRLDAAFLVGNYPAVHLSLWALGVLSLMAGLISWPRFSALMPRRSRLEGALYLAILVLGCSLALFSQSTSLTTRQGMANSSAGRLLLSVFPYSFSRQFATAPLSANAATQNLDATQSLDATQNLEEFSGLRGKYNILLITLDGMRADHLTPSIAPSLSRFAEQSAQFEYSYAQGPKTLIGLTALLTGRYSAHTPWIRLPGTGKRQRWFPALEPGILLQERVKTRGYATLACLEGGGDALFTRDAIFARGFDEYVELGDLKARPDVSLRAAERAIEQRRKLGDMRFFQWVHFMDPHRSFKSDRYRELVSFSDAAIGTILESLREDNKLRDTVVVVSADHGRALGRGGVYGHATALSEEQIRVPLIIFVPGLPALRVTDVVGGIDVTNTLLFLAGAESRASGDGLNLLPTLVGDELPARVLFSELHNDDSSDPGVPRKLQAAIRFPYKLILDEPRGVAAVYNIASDHFEERPLTGQLAQQMTQETLRFFAATTHPRSRFGSDSLHEP